MENTDENMEAHLRALAGEEALKSTLDKMGNTYFINRKKSPVRRLLPGLLAAAAIGLLLLLALPGLLAPATPPTYEQFAQHVPLAITERGTANNAAAAETAFNAGNYALSIPELRRYLDNNPNDQTARLALGIALLETDDTAAATTEFRSVAATNGQMADYGNWYLALTALKDDRPEECARILAEIDTDDPYLKKRVADLSAAL